MSWLVFVLGSMCVALVLFALGPAVPFVVLVIFGVAVLVVGLYILFTRDSSDDPIA